MAVVHKREAERILHDLQARRAVDNRYHIVREGEHVLVPLRDQVEVEEAIGYVERDIAMRRVHSPHERIDMRLDLPPTLMAMLPRKWEMLGDVLVFRLPRELGPFKREIAQVYAEELNARTVVRDLNGISGEFRRPEVEVLYGNDTETTHPECGIRYRMDVTKVMFASGNVDERERMGRIDCSGETVVDMFAGIGYFTLPLAVHGRAKRVLACEKNPESHRYLTINIALNGVEDRVRTFLGDNRDLPGERFADRVVMGYVGVTSEFLPKGISLCKEGGIVHFHDTYNIGDLPHGPEEDIRRAAMGREFEMLQLREVKSYAPSVSHMVADVRFL